MCLRFLQFIGFGSASFPQDKPFYIPIDRDEIEGLEEVYSFLICKVSSFIHIG